MEPASELVARPLPTLLQLNGTTEPSVSTERISVQLLHEWHAFFDEIAEELNSHDLSAQVSLTDSTEGEFFAVGSELGLTGRVTNNLCDPVAKALATTSLSVRFGDVQVVKGAKLLPDFVSFRLQNASSSRPTTILIFVGEIKTFWTLPLEEYHVTGSLAQLLNLEPHVGQLVSYMRANELRYGLLTTYKTTVFVRRVSDYRFELSPPIDEKATQPSVRECLLGFCTLASSSNANYYEPHDFEPLRLRGSSITGYQASVRPSTYRTLVAEPQSSPQVSTPPAGLEVSSQSICIGAAGVSHSVVHCTRLISGNPETKAVYEVNYRGTPAIAKCWADQFFESYATESAIYEKLYKMRPQGFDCFASFLEYGKIMCSSVFPVGHILVLAKVEGERLSDTWDDLDLAAKNHVRNQCRKAVSILRNLHVYSSDAGKHNVLYCRTSGAVTMLDLESVGDCFEEELVRNLDAPELLAIFGRAVMREPIIGG